MQIKHCVICNALFATPGIRCKPCRDKVTRTKTTRMRLETVRAALGAAPHSKLILGDKDADKKRTTYKND